MSRVSSHFIIILCLVGVVTTIAAAQSPAPATSASIAGTVVGDDGKPLAAFVTANRTTKPIATGSSAPAKDGSFSINKLSAGTYSLCAAAKDGGYLNPCTWGPAILVTLNAGQNLTGYRIVLKRGRSLQVHLTDAGQALSAAAAPGKPAPHVMVGILTPQRIFEPLALIGKDTQGRTHEGTISADQNAQLLIRGNGVSISDSLGTAVASNGSTVTVKPAPGNQPIVLTFNIAKGK